MPADLYPFFNASAMEKEQLSPAESLALIQSMIEKARNKMYSNSVYFLLWGWVTLVACIGQYVLKAWLQYPHHYLTWLLMLPTAVISMYIGMRQYKKRQTTSFVDDAMNYLWTGMGITFFVLSMLFVKLGWGFSVFPFFMMLYGLGTFVSGRLLRFAPLVVGGIMSWALSIVAIYVSYDHQLLCGAAAILVSYIVPAHILRKKEAQAINA
jgi:hypothetical protein